MLFFTMILLMSLNVNGLRDINKMKTVFTTIKSKHCHITFLQETFWDDNFIEQYKHLWEGKILYNNCPLNNRKGVAILISNDCPYNFTFDSCDNEGRILKVSANIEDCDYSFINVYTPNKVDDKIVFFNKLAEYISDPEENIILGGDFNEILNPCLDLGINNVTFSKKSSNALHSFINTYNLSDIWRHRNPIKKEFSRQQIVEDIVKQSRIDMFFISKSLTQFVTNVYISYTMISDHNFVCVKLDFSRIERGQGIWIFNNQLLHDEDFCDGIRNIINNECQYDMSEPLVWWDNLKYKMKKYALYFAINKRKLDNQKYYYIQNSLKREYAKLAINKNYDVTKLKILEEELQEIENIKCKGAILRSKVQWSFESDKNTKFFLNLEKSKKESNTIKELKTDNGITRKTEDILKYVQDFYSKLYTKESINIEKRRGNFTFN